MDDSRQPRTALQKPGSHTAWDGTPDKITPHLLDRISEESRQVLLAACRAATMDGFMLVAAVIPAKTDADGYAWIDETRQASGFTNLERDSDLASLLQWAANRLKGRV